MSKQLLSVVWLSVMLAILVTIVCYFFQTPVEKLHATDFIILVGAIFMCLLSADSFLKPRHE